MPPHFAQNALLALAERRVSDAALIVSCSVIFVVHMVLLWFGVVSGAALFALLGALGFSLSVIGDNVSVAKRSRSTNSAQRSAGDTSTAWGMDSITSLMPDWLASVWTGVWEALQANRRQNFTRLTLIILAICLVLAYIASLLHGRDLVSAVAYIVLLGPVLERRGVFRAAARAVSPYVEKVADKAGFSAAEPAGPAAATAVRQ